jgi:hypothetical protein
MTTATQPLPDMALLERLQQVLAAHPGGAAIRLVYTVDELPTAPDEVMVQQPHPDRRVLELRPTRFEDITPDDVLHATQTISPDDPAFGMPAAEALGSGYHKVNGTHMAWT